MSASNTAHVPMDEPHLSRYGANAARALELEGAVRPGTVAREMRRALAEVERARQELARWAEESGRTPGAVEWLLDNAYLAAREGRMAERAFRRGRPLRRCRNGQSVLQCAARTALWAVPDLDRRRLTVFLSAFQSVLPLTERELSLLVPALTWALLCQLRGLCGDLAALREEQTGPAPFESVFAGLRALSDGDWGALLESESRVEAVLRQDPAGCYGSMEDATRRRYRGQVCRLARKSGMGEEETARRVLELSRQGAGAERHVGWFLFRRPLGAEKRTRSGACYGPLVLLSAALLSAALALLLDSWVGGLLLFFPLSDLVKNSADFLLVRLVPPRPVHRMALESGIPPEGRTLCVIAALLTGKESGRELAEKLERYHLANRDSGGELRLGMLADLPDRDSPMGAEGRSWVREARKEVDRLNRKYGGGFYLFFREPRYSARDGRWMGWERKRGALVELVRLLKDRPSGLEVLSGDRGALADTRYVITLDSDTSLNVGAARELVGAMLHPLNQPEVDRERRVVTEGYALLQPRVAVELAAANRSLFSRVFAGLGGVDPYGSAASDVYHDLFDQGTYTGKGIFQVDAFYACLDRRVPEGRVLSHDLLEGSYLRAGLLGEVELTDGFPYQVRSYYARLNRWIRGDWQLLPWLLPRVPDGRGGREKNPLPPLARWKLLDNLRRSLSPIFTLAALVLGICGSGAALAAAGGAAILSAASNLLLSGMDLAARRGGRARGRYHSTVVAGLPGALLQTALQLLFLPYHAWVSACAVCTALWRMGVTGRDLLAWVTADQSERGGGNGLWSYYRREWFSPAVGLATFLLAELRIGSLAGLLWMAAPAAAWWISRPSGKRAGLAPGDRAFLLHQATLIWRYFASFLREEDHWLPPDNWQEKPAAGLARRTSPTNIGLALLSVMAAVDLDLLPQDQGAGLIRHVLNTVEGLEKWRGHLYNWYDTVSARPMAPRYISTVDSGNLCGSLIALAAGLEEWGEGELAARARALSGAMEFRPLYDPDGRLFFIGWEAERDRPTPGHYDLMASEARQTSYVTVARGEVPPRHWRRLSRMLLGDNDYSGMASWTGTMFEYFMPNLLLPCEENSLMYESLAFCVYAQKRRGARTHTPWGISESGFFAFDPGMTYQYKAHGVQALGLKRGLDQELVVAPYASFLALPMAPKSAVRNLRRLCALGLEGRFGLYEAADFTPSRLSGGSSFEIVRSYMAHHLGMSLVAIDNALTEDVMQRRFLSDRTMAAYRELLQERVPVGAPVMRRRDGAAPERPRRRQGPDLLRTGEGAGRLSPRCHLVSEGGYCVFAADNGQTRSSLGRDVITLAEPGEYQAPAGVSWFFSGAEGMIGLTAAPLYRGDCRYSWEFYDGGAVWTCQRGGLTARTGLALARLGSGELRRAELHWDGEGVLEGELLCYLEPVLCGERDHLAHPAFSKLFVESRAIPGGVSFRRRPRGAEEHPVLAALWDGEGSTFTTSRQAALGRGGLRALAGGGPGPLKGETGAVLDPCLMVRLPVRLRPGESCALRLALGVSDRLDAAADTAQRLLEGREEPGGMLAPIAQRLGLDQVQALGAFALLRHLASVRPGAEGRPPQCELWQFGISGDLPIAAAPLEGGVGEDKIGLWCAQHRFLTRAGWPFDLVFLAEEGGDYRRPLLTAVREALRALGAESALGARGGVHLVDPGEGFPTVLAWASARLPLELMEEEPEHWTPPPAVSVRPEPAPWHFDQAGSVVIRAGERLPPVGWSQILCGESFGWLTDETGNGLLWRENAHEGRLTRWKNDPLAVGGEERLLLETGGICASVFADGDGLPCTVTYGPGFALWEKRFGETLLVTEGHVPPDRPERVLRFALSGGAGTLSIQRRDGEASACPVAEGLPAVLVSAPGERGGLVHRWDALPPERAEAEGEQVVLDWRKKVSALRFSTPEPALDRYLNGWALYQVLACRLMARTSQYQNGGAYGFRDQLQDVRALLLTVPERAREQLVLASSRQFPEGDVQHWWHPPHGAGVRTRITDDLLWLPYVLAEYLEVTGDWSVCGEKTCYLESPPLREGERERYETPRCSEREDTVYRHALAAIRCAVERGAGSHGLALIGGGDWNDGMNRVGAGGRGESVWLTWFLALVLRKFAPVCRHMEEPQLAEELLGRAEGYRKAAEAAWDGSWYRRGYFDSGAPLGTRGAESCEIDSIAQSFAALVEDSDRERACQAVSAALERLYLPQAGVVKLFDPPFQDRGPDPGYIKGYLPGVRENGGQYTHGAVWLALACLRLGRTEDGLELLRALLPERRRTQIYQAEPYVLAADVYAAPGHLGRGGWSWYTGAAGWYYRTAVEELLGLKIREGRLFVEPHLPEDWPGWTGEWELDRGRLSIQVSRGRELSVRLDGREIRDGVPLRELTGDHRLEVTAAPGNGKLCFSAKDVV